jgi:hypothetical protein
MVPITPEPRRKSTAVVFAKDQPQYCQLPANVHTPYVETKWKLSWRERLTILVKGTLYLTLKTFGQPLQPIRMSILREED